MTPARPRRRISNIVPSSRVRALALVLAALAPRVARALDPAKAVSQYVLRVFRMEQGLPHNAVTAVLPSRDGFLWLGTYAGLARFDGVTFTVYSSRNSGLGDNQVLSLADDGDSILIGTSTGGLFRMRQGLIAHLGLEGTVYDLKRTRDGVLWAATSRGLLRVDRPGTRLTKKEGLPGDVVTHLAPGADGSLFVGCPEGVARILDGRILRLPFQLGARLLSLFCDRDGRLWIGTSTELLRFDGDRLAFAAPVGGPGGVQAILQDRDGVVWAGSYGDGLLRVERDGRVSVFGPGEGFADRRVWAIAEDREGSLWLGTRAGLAQLLDGVVTTYGRQEGMPADLTRCVSADADGSVLVGTEHGAVRIAADRTLHRLQGAPDGLVYSFTRGRDGDLWIGTDRGVTRLGAGGTRSFTSKDGVPGGIVKVLLEDRAGRIWIGAEEGLGVLAPGASKVENPDALSILRGQSLEALYEDRSGELWIGTLRGGLYRFDRGGLTPVPLVPSAVVGVRALHGEADGTLIVGTLGAGLFVRHGGRFARITSGDGLLADGIWSIVNDGAGTLFMSTDLGIFGVARRQLDDFVLGKRSRIVPAVTLSAADGMKSRECNGGGGSPAAVDRAGNLWFPTQKGVVVVDPRRLGHGEQPPRTVIDEVLVDRRPVSLSSAIRIPPGSRDLEFRYTAPTFTDPSRILFRHRLVGQDDDWVPAGTSRSAVYGALAPGHYELVVQASNRDGIWDENGARIAVTVVPRLGQRWSVRAGIAVIFVLAAVAGVRRRVGWLTRRKAELEVLVGERTRELADANAALHHLATIDALTGVANRRRFDETLEREWSRARRQGTPVSLLLLDIDQFKAFNDRFGHQVGDACLAAVGRVLLESARRSVDVAARYGGEEFAVILPLTNARDARELAESIRARIAGLEVAIPLADPSTAPRITVSIGVSCLVPGPDSGAESLVALADQALYRAKDSGRDRVESQEPFRSA